MRIVILEDEADIADAVADVLRRDGYVVVWAADRGAFFDAVAEAPTDLVILDVMLPEGEEAGFDIARRLRSVDFEGSILFMTARDAVDDRIAGLDLGGDDYLLKPFSLRELRARVRALLRRSGSARSARLVRGRLAVDLAARSAHWDGIRLALSEREFAMLELFLHEPERTWSTHELLDRLFPDASSGPAVVRVYVRQLRTKCDPDLIETVRGGYRLGRA